MRFFFDSVVYLYRDAYSKTNFKTADVALDEKIFSKVTDIAKEVTNTKGGTQDYPLTEDERPVSTMTMCGGHYLPLGTLRNIEHRRSEPGKVTLLIEGRTVEVDKAQIIAGMKKPVDDGIFCSVSRPKRVSERSVSSANCLWISKKSDAKNRLLVKIPGFCGNYNIYNKERFQ